MGNTVQKFMLAITGLGALALVVANPKGVAAAAKGFRGVVGGTVTDVVKAGNNG